MKTDMLYLAKGGFWLSVGSISGSFAAFLLAILLVNTVPKEAFGTYKYILSLVGVFTSFTLSGLSEALSRSAAKGHDGDLRTVAIRAIPWNMLSGALALVAASYYFASGARTIAAGFLLVAIVTPLNAEFNLYAGMLKGKKAFAQLTKYGLIRAFLPVIATATTLLCTREALPLAAAYLGATVVGNAIAYAWTRKAYPSDGTSDPTTMRFGLHLSLMNVLGALASSIDKVIVFHYLGAANVAIYSIAQALPEQIDGIVSNVRHLALPKFAGQNPQATIRTLPRKILLYVLLLLILVGVYALMVKPFFQLLFPQYLEAVPYSIALAFAFAATAPGQLSLAYLAAHGAIRERYILGPVFSSIWIVLMIIFCRAFGLWGLVAAKLLIKYGGLMVGFWLTWRHALRSSQTPFPASL